MLQQQVIQEKRARDIRLGKVPARPVFIPIRDLNADKVKEAEARTKELLGRVDALNEEIVAMQQRAQDLAQLVQEAVPPEPVQPVVTVRAIMRATCRFYQVPMAELKSDRRHNRILPARHMAMYLAKALTLHSYPAIGKCFGRDHTTVLHAFNKVEAKLKEDEGLRAEVETLTKIILGGDNVE